MKKIISILFLCITVLNARGQEEKVSIDVKDSKKLGLVGYLTYVKAMSEYKMTSLINDTISKDPKAAKEFYSKYNLLKLSTDQLINQMSADLISCNKLKLYRRLNKFLQNNDSLPQKYKHYESLIKLIDRQLKNFTSPNKSTESFTIDSTIETFVGVITEGREIVTSARDFREKKIQSLITIAKELKLLKLSELVKPKEKETKD